MTDKNDVARVAGEEWIVRKVGTYMPGPYEEIVQQIRATVLTDTKAVHVEAIENFTDIMGKERKIGEQWLVTKEHTQAFIPSGKFIVSVAQLQKRQMTICCDLLVAFWSS